MEIDNHTDTTALESNFLLIHDFGRSVDVSWWDTIFGSVECTTISGAISYDNLISGKVSLLVYQQAIHCPRLTSRLMCPMQSRMIEVRINELPKFLAEYPDDQTHGIIVDDPLNPNEPLVSALLLKGITSYFPYRNPKTSECEDESIPHIYMIGKTPMWEPSETSF